MFTQCGLVEYTADKDKPKRKVAWLPTIYAQLKKTVDCDNKTWQIEWIGLTKQDIPLNPLYPQ